MAFDGIIKVKLANGALDTEVYAGGLVNNCPDSGTTFSLGMRRGCLGGVLTLTGRITEAYTIDIGRTLEFWYDATHLVYSGVVCQRRKFIERNEHEYELEGWWANLLKKVSFSRLVALAADGTPTADTAVKRIVFGSDITADDDGSTTGERRVADCETPEAIVTWLLNNLLDDYGVTYTAGDIVASGVAVKNFVIQDDADIYQVLEALEVMASAKAAGDFFYVCGIDAAKGFYFKPVSTSSGDVQGTFTIGANITQGDEEDRGVAVSNNITIVGGMQDDKGRPFRRGFAWSPSVTAVGRTRNRTLGVPNLRFEADAQKFALGYFRRAAPATGATNEEVVFSGVRKVHAAAEAPPLPHAGQVQFFDVESSQIKQDYLSQLNVYWGAAFDYDVAIGAESLASAAGSYYSSTNESNLSSSYVGTANLDSLSESWLSLWPEDTDQIDAYDDATHMTGPLVPADWKPGTEPAGFGALEVGQAAVWVADVMLDGVSEFSPVAMVSNGGNADALNEANTGTANPVYIFYEFRTVAGAVIAQANFALAFIGQRGKFNHYSAEVTFGYTPAYAGRFYYALRVQTAPGTYVWTPCQINSGSNYVFCPWANAIDASGASSFTSLLVRCTGLVDEV